MKPTRLCLTKWEQWKYFTFFSAYDMFSAMLVSSTVLFELAWSCFLQHMIKTSDINVGWNATRWVRLRLSLIWGEKKWFVTLLWLPRSRWGVSAGLLQQGKTDHAQFFKSTQKVEGFDEKKKSTTHFKSFQNRELALCKGLAWTRTAWSHLLSIEGQSSDVEIKDGSIFLIVYS